jgi:hypothetical protein
MTRLFKHLLSGMFTKGRKGPTVGQHVRLECEAMEQRLLMTTGLTTVGIIRAPVGVFDPSLSKSAHDLQMGLPLLDSNPKAPATLYLDFTGDFEQDWFQNNSNGTQTHFSNINTPAFNLNANTGLGQDPAPETSFTDSEEAMITQIWARVAEDFAPFNINVSTHYYGSFNNPSLTYSSFLRGARPTLSNHPALHVVVGGWGTWNGAAGGTGVSSIGSFHDSAPNVVFVFAQDIVWYANHNGQDFEGRPLDIAAATATTISHESGHAFGLLHHSSYDANGNKTDEYDHGTADWTPIMGNNLSSDRTTWYNGPTDQGPNTSQDDMAIISGLQNGFGYRADDHGNTIATAGWLTPVKSRVAFLGPIVAGHGIIEKTSDVDAFKFSAPGGPIVVTVDPAQYGPNLMPRVELWSSAGLIASADPGRATEASIVITVPAGTYYVFVKSHGDYGDVGQYTTAVDLNPIAVIGTVMTAAPPAPQTPTPPTQSFTLATVATAAGSPIPLATQPPATSWANSAAPSSIVCARAPSSPLDMVFTDLAVV